MSVDHKCMRSSTLFDLNSDENYHYSVQENFTFPVRARRNYDRPEGVDHEPFSEFVLSLQIVRHGDSFFGSDTEYAAKTAFTPAQIFAPDRIRCFTCCFTRRFEWFQRLKWVSAGWESTQS